MYRICYESAAKNLHSCRTLGTSNTQQIKSRRPVEPNTTQESLEYFSQGNHRHLKGSGAEDDIRSKLYGVKVLNHVISRDSYRKWVMEVYYYPGAVGFSEWHKVGRKSKRG
ncbi:hypothetical protein TELCIR_01896 [Teladorsagia circumcincta]|uniref:Uncharacterized protein n=1 Tax=Teladorsagia circumcincta TaxID=45464 RepID=A0A2G9V0L6_TELCI|nr:hypothetical protein TELCIR_01896 [Teladorsagia circumcincta]